MKKRFTIKKIIALFLLGVFTLGITPKKELHGLLANHKDNTAKSGDGRTQQLTKAGINCKCDDLVAESNFIAGIGFINITAPVVYRSVSTSFYNSYLSLQRRLFNLRGPPVKF